MDKSSLHSESRAHSVHSNHQHQRKKMFKYVIVAALLAFAAAKPLVVEYPVGYTAPYAAAYTAPVAYSAYSAYTAPVAYSAYSAYSPYAYYVR